MGRGAAVRGGRSSERTRSGREREGAGGGKCGELRGGEGGARRGGARRGGKRTGVLSFAVIVIINIREVVATKRSTVRMVPSCISGPDVCPDERPFVRPLV